MSRNQAEKLLIASRKEIMNLTNLFLLHNRARKKQTVQTLTAVACYHTTTSIQRLLLAQFLNAPIGEELESEIGEKLFKSGVQCSLLPTSTQQEEELTKVYGTENKIDQTNDQF